MKKMMVLMMFIFVLVLTGCNLEVDDSDKRTYEGVVYDKVFSNSVSEGLKCRTENYYLFNESDNIVLKHEYYTCGRGKVTEYLGSWEGSLESKIIITIDEGSGVQEYEFTFDEYNMYDIEENEYDKEDVKSTIIYMENRSYLKEE